MDFQDLLNASKSIEPRPVSLPGNLELFVRQMTVVERCDLEDQMADEDSRTLPFRLELLRRCVVDRDGDTFLMNVEIRQLEQLGSAIVEPLVDAALKLNGFTRRDQEDLEKK